MFSGMSSSAAKKKERDTDTMGWGEFVYKHAIRCYREENPGTSVEDWDILPNDAKQLYYKRPVKIPGEGTPGKFYFRITNPKYQLVEITKANALHHYSLCFESIPALMELDEVVPANRKHNKVVPVNYE